MLRRLLATPRAWFEAALAPAADPRTAYGSPAERHLKLLEDLRHSLQLVGESRSRLAARSAEAEARLPELEARARQAVAAGRLDLARLALQRRQAAAADLAELRRQLEELDSEEVRLQLVEQKVSGAVDAFRAKQELARAKFDAAVAQVRVGEALAGVTGDLGDLGVGLEEAEAAAGRMEARAAAIDRLMAEGGFEGSPIRVGAGLDAEIEAQLRVLQEGEKEH